MAALPWIIAASAITFGVTDWMAARNAVKGDTASELIRRMAGIDPRRPWRPAGVAAVAGGCAWLAIHLIQG